MYLTLLKKKKPRGNRPRLKSSVAEPGEITHVDIFALNMI